MSNILTYFSKNQLDQFQELMLKNKINVDLESLNESHVYLIFETLKKKRKSTDTKKNKKNYSEKYNSFTHEPKISMNGQQDLGRISEIEKRTRTRYPSRQETYEKKTVKQYYQKAAQIHDEMVEKIYNNPSLIGINDTFYNAETEVDFFNKTDSEGAVDLLIETKNNIYAVEYKNRHCKNNRKHAKIQLKKAKYHIKKNFGTDITKFLYVSGDFNTEILNRLIHY